MNYKSQFLEWPNPALQPKEERLETGRKKASLFLGIPRESAFQERRISLAPDAVSVLVSEGHRVIVERGAGEHASFSDRDFSEAGAEIADHRKRVFECDMIIKVHPPTPEEMALMKPQQLLISALQLQTQEPDFFKNLMEKKISAIAWDYMRDEENAIPIVRSMSEIAGNTSILIAAELMSNTNQGSGLMLGGISGVSPAQVVILGAGTVGEYAARAALGLGAQVMVFDRSISKLRRLQDHLPQRIATSVIQPRVLEKSILRADLVVGAIRATEGKTPCLIEESLVQKMKARSVVVDVSIDQGGCFETSELTSHESPTFIKHGVIHYCVPNIPSRVARTASFSLSNLFLPLLRDIGDHGGIEQLIRTNRGLRQGMYMHRGAITNRGIAQWFELPFTDLDLMVSAW